MYPPPHPHSPITKPTAQPLPPADRIIPSNCPTPPRHPPHDQYRTAALHTGSARPLSRCHRHRFCSCSDSQPRRPSDHQAPHHDWSRRFARKKANLRGMTTFFFCGERRSPQAGYRGRRPSVVQRGRVPIAHPSHESAASKHRPRWSAIPALPLEPDGAPRLVNPPQLASPRIYEVPDTVHANHRQPSRPGGGEYHRNTSANSLPILLQLTPFSARISR